MYPLRWSLLLGAVISWVTWWTSHYGAVRGWSPQELQPISASPTPAKPQGSHTLHQDINKENLTGSWAQNQSSSDDRSGTSEDGAAGCFGRTVYFFTIRWTWKLEQYWNLEHCSSKGFQGSAKPILCCYRQAHHKTLYKWNSLYVIAVYLQRWIKSGSRPGCL